MNANFTPILVVSAVPHKEGIRFLHRETQFDVGPEIANNLWKILSFVNGYNDIAAIAELAKLPEEYVFDILSELNELEIVVDAREQFLHFHRISNYPTTFNNALSQEEIEEYSKSARALVKTGRVFKFKNDTDSSLYHIRERRRSCRKFSKCKLTIDQIGSICNYAYSIKDHSVPSGGALYPLKIYVLIEKDQEGIKSGYYEYDAELDNLICFSNEVDEEQLKYCFNQEEIPFGSSIQIIIAADLKRQSYKYANRGYRLSLIEVGHVAENINLYCSERGFGSCEMGGVQDESLKAELELDENIWPILAITIGYPADSESDVFNKIRYVEKNVGNEHTVKNIYISTFGEDSAFFGATTTYEDGNGKIQFAGATSTSYADAAFKATIEGYERWLSGRVRVDFYGSANELNEAWAHPKLIAPLTNEQAMKNKLACFTKDLTISWTKGRLFNGSEIYVPSDIVYYGQKTGENRIYFGHSSGIAAYSNIKEAEKRALIELIERDALMQNWYKRKSPNIVGDILLPIHVKKRAKHWAKQNRKLIILQMPSDYGWVFEAIIVSDEYPCFVSGAAATIEYDSIHQTIVKALQEVEFNLLSVLRNLDRSEISPKEVLTPSDHGRVYYSESNKKKIEWLWSGKIEDHFEVPIRCTNLVGLQKILDVFFVDLSEVSSDLKVVRAFSPKLVPINFGFNSAHYTHPTLGGKVNPQSLEMPHYFA